MRTKQFTLLALFCLFIGSVDALAKEKKPLSEEDMVKLEALEEKAAAIVAQIEVLRAEKKTAVTKAERKELRQEIQALKAEAKAVDAEARAVGGGIYIGGGALLLAILLILLL